MNDMYSTWVAQAIHANRKAVVVLNPANLEHGIHVKSISESLT